MKVKRSSILLISITAFYISCLNAGAATNWGTKGVADTSKIKNILQVTGDGTTPQRKMLAGRGYPEYTSNTTKPWSKDGDWIAFTAMFGGTSSDNEEICKIKPDGSSFTRLTNDSVTPVSDSNASFSFDGKIYYTHRTASYRDEVWKMDADGSNPTNLSAAHSETTTSEQFPLVSPDGTKVAFLKSGFLYVMNADGTSPVKVSGKYPDGTTDLWLNYGQYSWSPDSQSLAFIANDGTGEWVFVATADGSQADSIITSLTKETPPLNANHRWPEWSPDATRIAYQQELHSGAPDYTVTYSVRTITTAGASDTSFDSAISNATPGWDQLGGPFAWSPDSKWFVYRKRYYDGASNYNHALFMVDTSQASPTPVQLTEEYNDFLPSFSPDGTQILFQSQGNSSAATREDPVNGDTGDLLIMNLGSFPWPMFMPAVQNSDNK